MTTTGKTRGRPPSGGREEILKATLGLIRERGMARLTTREVAERAGVSEGSIFYHFADRSGLLKAVFERSLDTLKDLSVMPYVGDDIRATLSGFARAVGEFLESGLDVLMAAQADAELREAVIAFLTENDYGPQRGIGGIGGYLAQRQEVGAVRPDVDPRVIAYMVVSDALQRSAQPKLFGTSRGVPTPATFLDTLLSLIEPPTP